MLAVVVMLPLTLATPVTPNPVDENVPTVVPATPTVVLPFSATATFDVPLVIEEPAATVIPVN